MPSFADLKNMEDRSAFIPAAVIDRRRFLSHPTTPAMACRVAPTATPIGSDKDLRTAAGWVASKDVQILTNSDPIKMPGQTPRPNNRMPAKAIPAAGQTAVAYPGGIANSKGSLPTTKYARPRPPI
jgi:hypothetical protein